MKQVAAINATTAWGLNNGGSLFKLNGAAWAKLGCCVSQISIGVDGELWATNPPTPIACCAGTAPSGPGTSPRG
jgi:hypothetical protein